MTQWKVSFQLLHFEAWILQIILSVSRLFWLFLGLEDVWGSPKKGGGFFWWMKMMGWKWGLFIWVASQLRNFSWKNMIVPHVFFPHPWHVRYPLRHHQKVWYFFVVFGGFGKWRKWLGNPRSSHHNQSSNQAAKQTTKQRNEQRNKQQFSFRLPKAVKKWTVQKIQHEIWHLNKEFDWRFWDFLNTWKFRVLMRWKDFLTVFFPGLWQFSAGIFLRCIWILFQFTWDTLDGRNPAPPGMYKTLQIMGYTTYQLVQDFFHQQYVLPFSNVSFANSKFS